MSIPERHHSLLAYHSIQRWLGNLLGRSKITYLDGFHHWFRWLQADGGVFINMSPDDLVAYQKEYKDHDIKDQVQLWMRENEARGFRQNTLNRLYSTVNSFFRYNRAGLPDDVFKMHSKTPAVAGTLSIDEFRQVVLASNPLYQAVFMCMFAGIMGAGELLYWSNNGYENLVEQLERRERIIRANQSGRKLYANIMPFYNWIGGDALNQLRVYLDDYRPEGPGPIFITKQRRGLNYRALRDYWTRKLKELGIIREPEVITKATRYGKNPHEIRDLARTVWRKSPADVLLAEFMMGHSESLDPNKYEKIYRDLDYSRMEYRKALPWLCPLTQDPDKIPREKYEQDMARLDVLEEKVDVVNRLLENPESAPHMWEALKRFEESTKKK